MAFDIMKMMGVDAGMVKEIGDQYEKRLVRMEQLSDYQTDLLEKICAKLGVDIEEEHNDG